MYIYLHTYPRSIPKLQSCNEFTYIGQGNRAPVQSIHVRSSEKDIKAHETPSELRYEIYITSKKQSCFTNYMLK